MSCVGATRRKTKGQGMWRGIRKSRGGRRGWWWKYWRGFWQRNSGLKWDITPSSSLYMYIYVRRVTPLPNSYPRPAGILCNLSFLWPYTVRPFLRKNALLTGLRQSLGLNLGANGKWVSGSLAPKPYKYNISTLFWLLLSCLISKRD